MFTTLKWFKSLSKLKFRSEFRLIRMEFRFPIGISSFSDRNIFRYLFSGKKIQSDLTIFFNLLLLHIYDNWTLIYISGLLVWLYIHFIKNPIFFIGFYSDRNFRSEIFPIKLYRNFRSDFFPTNLHWKILSAFVFFLSVVGIY